MRSRVRFPALPWEFSLKGNIPTVTMVWVRLVEFRFKAPPGATSSSVTIYTSSGQRNCASWASQPQKSVTLLPCPGGRTTKSTKDMWWHWEKKKKNLVGLFCSIYESGISHLMCINEFISLKTGWQKMLYPFRNHFPQRVLLVDGKQINIWWRFEKLFRFYGLVCQNALLQAYLVFCEHM